MTQATLESQIQTVRRFNRFYTRQIGVLQEHLLESPYSLTEVRVLYELAHRERSTATELCRELGLDAGYVSRLLRTFEKRGLVEKRSSSEDARQIELTLTAAGRKTFATLDQQSSREVEKLLRGLPANGREGAIEAMRRIEKTLVPQEPPKIPYILRPPQPGDLGWVVQRHGVLYAREYGYDERFEALVARIVADFVEHFDAKRERCWIAERDGEPAGTVFLVRETDSVAKLRLLLVEPSARGLGIGMRLVEECVRFAKQARYKKMVLWTQSELKAARGIYKKAGFRLVEEKPHQSWGRKDLVSEVWELKL
jgi:DNA-binding MarR family transcriptional regulator/predicted N-acetyltransferase YhbS